MFGWEKRERGDVLWPLLISPDWLFSLVYWGSTPSKGVGEIKEGEVMLIVLSEMCGRSMNNAIPKRG